MGKIIVATEEYLNGFRRYIPIKRGPGRPHMGDQISYLDSPRPLQDLPPIGEKVLIYETIIQKDISTREQLLFDLFETDIHGRPIVLKVKEITNNIVQFEQTIETFNDTHIMSKPIPCAWITSGHIGWVTVKDFYKRLNKLKKEEKE